MTNRDYIPIYQRLTDFYRKKILSQEYEPGSKIDSINRIMTRHNVSRETAKRVIKILSDENLVISRAGKGTFANPYSEINKIWAMVVPIYSSNIEQLINAVNYEAQAMNRKLDYFLHYNNPDEEIRIISELIQKGYEAIIVVPNFDESHTSEFYKNILTGKTKIILADNTMAGSYFEYVIQSYDLGVKRAVDYLGKSHNGNFLFLKNERWKGKNLVYELMESTFNFLTQTKYPDRSVFVVSNMQEINANFIKQNNITGILSIQDSNTIRAIGRLKQWGFSIPTDISIVSYGNTELTKYFTPAITVVDCKYEKMAENIISLITNNNKLASKQIVIQPKLIIRET